MFIMNVDPTIAIYGPPSVRDAADYVAVVSDPSKADVLSVRWAVDGFTAGTGQGFHYVPTSLHEHFLSAVVTDDDGGSGYAIRIVKVFSPEPKLTIVGPIVIRSGQSYKLTIGNVSLGLYGTDQLTWRRDGVDLGKGQTLTLFAGASGSERTDVGVLDEGTFLLCDSITVRVREPLMPPTCAPAVVVSTDTVDIHWTPCDQLELFRRYIVRASSVPLPVNPSPGLEWMGDGDQNRSTWVETTQRSEAAHEFNGLKPGWTYCFCVYVVGDDEVACSNSVVATIPALVGEETGNHYGVDTGGGIGTPFVVIFLIVLIVLLVGMVGLHIINKRRNRGRIDNR